MCVCVYVVLFSFFLAAALFLSSNHHGNVLKLTPQHGPRHCYFTAEP